MIDSMSQHYQGVGGVPGITIGQVYRHLPFTSLPQQGDEGAEDAATALERFAAAQQRVADYLARLAEQMRSDGHTDEAAILDTQALFAEDIAISDEMTRRVAEEHQPLEPALAATIRQLRDSFASLNDDYLRQRASDIEHIGTMLHIALRGGSFEPAFASLPPGAVIVAADLSPAETATLRGGTVAGFATAYGGPTSHTAIMARSLGIPAVVGLGAAILELADATEVILDGGAALLIARPEPAECRSYEQQLAILQTTRQRQQTLRDLPGQLADGQRVALWANIGHPDEMPLALEHGAEGIGLFRTEFLFLERHMPPDEEEQYAAYRQVVELMAGRTVVIRTLDIGGDKPLPYLDLPTEPNPFLGRRGLRLCMRQPHLLQTQVRALLRAALHGDLRIMLPMISTLDDLTWGQTQVQAAAASLAAENTPHKHDVPLGIMIETPAAAVTADLFARQAAFLSVGSNDLTQYTMAADRGIAEFAATYPSNSPAVLRLIAQAAAAARQAGVSIGVCGELASVPEVAPLLVALGINELSMAPAAIPPVKERLRGVSLAEAQAAAQRAMAQ